MKLRRATRGQPLIALGLVLGGWVVARALLWDVAAFSSRLPPTSSSERIGADFLAGPVMISRNPVKPVADRGTKPPADRAMRRFLPPVAPPAPRLTAPEPVDHSLRLDPPPSPVAPPQPTPLGHAQPSLEPRKLPVQVASGHQLLWMAALRLPSPPAAPAADPSHPTGGEIQPPIGHLDGRNFRLAGDAAPPSGPAPILSAGF